MKHSRMHPIVARFWLTWYSWRSPRPLNDLCEWIAWCLPRKLVYWCAIRLIAHATRYDSHRTPSEISVMDALNAWEQPDDTTERLRAG